MQISISARHGQLSTGTREKISDKVEKLHRYFDRMTAIYVTVDLEHKETPQVEVRVSAEHTPDFIGAEQSSDIVSALDLVLPKIESQLRRHKDKLTGHRSPGHRHLELPEPDAEADGV